METSRGNPFQFFRGMVHGVILPHPLAVKETMRPIQDDVLTHEEDQHLYDERQRRERPVTVVIKGDQAICRSDVKQQGGTDNEHADTQEACDHRNEKPVAKIGHQIAFLPPRPARVASPKPSQDGEHGRHRDRYRHTLQKGVADIQKEGEKFLTHVLLIAVIRLKPREGFEFRRENCA